jgi:hypothetical protein
MAETKKAFLEKEALLNPKPERVRHPLFETLEFFDPLDRLCVGVMGHHRVSSGGG